MSQRESSIPVEIILSNHQTTVALDLRCLEMALPAALSAVLAHPAGPRPSLLPDLDEISISLLSDQEIALHHGTFLNDPTPTDVITFHHGELLLSAGTAAREALHRDIPLERELLLYVIHGLLHLHGYDDVLEEDQSRMHSVQERLLQQVWPE